MIWKSPSQAVASVSVETYPLEDVSSLGYQPIQPIPRIVDLDPDWVALGERLFADPVLSEKGVSCEQCHHIDKNGADGLATSMDTRGGSDFVNTPTIFNVGFNSNFTWRGHVTTLEEQVDAVLKNKKHMDGKWENIIDRMRANDFYRRTFARVFPDAITVSNIKKVLAAYERSLITPDAPFDRFLNGEQGAISEDQKSGYHLFRQYGCVSCHQGVNVGGNLLAKLGTYRDPFQDSTETGVINAYNQGRYTISGDENDRHVFRVPSLRNVAVTAPYFHLGRVKTLESAVRFMAYYQVGREMPEQDVRLIAEFLKSLTGKYQGREL